MNNSTCGIGNKIGRPWATRQKCSSAAHQYLVDMLNLNLTYQLSVSPPPLNSRPSLSFAWLYMSNREPHTRSPHAFSCFSLKKQQRRIENTPSMNADDSCKRTTSDTTVNRWGSVCLLLAQKIMSLVVSLSVSLVAMNNFPWWCCGAAVRSKKHDLPII